MLNLLDGQLGLSRDRLERHGPLASRSTENGLDERHQADLLTEEIRVGLEDGLWRSNGTSSQMWI